MMCPIQPNKSPFRKYRTVDRHKEGTVGAEEKGAAGQLQIRRIIMIVSTTIKYYSIAKFHSQTHDSRCQKKQYQ